MQLFSYPAIEKYVLGAQKNRLIETVLLSTHNMCFCREIRIIIFSYAHLSGGCNIQESHGFAPIIIVYLFRIAQYSGKFFHDFLSSADFFQNQLFRKIISRIQPECQIGS